jgi:hypothetical protein
MRQGTAARTVPLVGVVAAPRRPGRRGDAADTGGALRAGLVAATEAAGVVADSRHLQASAPEIDPSTTQPAQLPRSQPSPAQDQEDGAVVGTSVGEEFADLLGREDARLDPAEDDLGIASTTSRGSLQGASWNNPS